MTNGESALNGFKVKQEMLK